MFRNIVKSRPLSTNTENDSKETLTVSYREEGSSANEREEVSASYCARASTSNCSNEVNYVNIKNRCFCCSSTAPSKEIQLNTCANTICNTHRSNKRITERPSDADYFTPIENAKEEVIYIVRGEIREKATNTGAHELQTPSRHLPPHGIGKVIKATDLLTSSSSSPLSSSSLAKESQPVKQLLEEGCNLTSNTNKTQSRSNISEDYCTLNEFELSKPILLSKRNTRNNVRKVVDNSAIREQNKEGETNGDLDEYLVPVLKKITTYAAQNTEFCTQYYLGNESKENKYISRVRDVEEDTYNKDLKPRLISNLRAISNYGKTENNTYENLNPNNFSDNYSPINDIELTEVIPQSTQEKNGQLEIKNRFSRNFDIDQEPNDRYDMGEDKRNKSVNNHLHGGRMNNLGGRGEKNEATGGTSNPSINRRASLAKIYTRNRSAVSASNLSSSALSSQKNYLNRGKDYARKGGLDSDGTSLGSGGDSDSSEEIHYGPGFVSKLKSRYLSVALRSSGPGRPSLRRTASLEDFLDKDKDDQQIELRKTTVTNIRQRRDNRNSKPLSTPSTQSHRNDPDTSHSSTGAYQPNRPRGRPTAKERFSSNMKNKSGRFEAVKRCQSVEVLSINETANKEKQEMPSIVPKDGKRNQVSRVEQDEDDEPPPLPPKSETLKAPSVYSPTNPKSSVESALKSSMMSNDVLIFDKKGDAIEGGKAPISPTTPAPSSTVLTSVRRPFQKRRSSGLLFGVEERELPAPDTVRETRKLFESRSSSTLAKKLMGPNGQTLTKSRSTSSLFSQRDLPVPNSSTSRYTHDRNQSSQSKINNSSVLRSSKGPTTSSHLNIRAGISMERSNSNSKSPVRRVSSSPNRSNLNNSSLTKKLNKQSSQSPTRRNTYVNSSQKTSLQRNAPKVTSKPTLPSKPAHLASSVNTLGLKTNKNQNVSSAGSDLVKSSSKAKDDSLTSTNSPKLVQFSRPVKSVYSENLGENEISSVGKLQDQQAEIEERNMNGADKSIKLVPVKPLNSEANVVQNKGGPDWKAKPSSPPLSAEDIEEGIKLVSSESIRNIRQGGNSFSFNFKSNNGVNPNIKSYLPDISKKPNLLPSDEDSLKYQQRNVEEDKADFSNTKRSISNNPTVASSYCYGLSPSSNVPKQIGVIKPMTREDLIHKETPNNSGDQSSPAISPTTNLKQTYSGNHPQNNTLNTEILNRMNSTVSQAVAIRAAATRPTAGLNDNKFSAKFQKEESVSEELTSKRTNDSLSSKYNILDKNAKESSNYKRPSTEIITASNNKESVHHSINREQEEKTMTHHRVLMSNGSSSNSLVRNHNGANKIESSTINKNVNMSLYNKSDINDRNNVPSVIKEQRDVSSNGTYNDLIVSAKPAKVVSSMKKCDSLSSSASNSSSSDEESAAERNGSYDLVIAEENRKNGIMSTNKAEFPAKKYEIINKAEVSKGIINTDNGNSNKVGNGGVGDTSYRDNWKARNKAEQSGTMVFNFVNTKRDVTHIENDGLDLSKRSSKKKTQIQLSKVRNYQTYCKFISYIYLHKHNVYIMSENCSQTVIAKTVKLETTQFLFQLNLQTNYNP